MMEAKRARRQGKSTSLINKGNYKFSDVEGDTLH